MSHEKYSSCIEACSDCTQECEHCATACLQEKDKDSLIRCIQLNRDCADLCALAVQWMSRGSEFAAQLCALCAEICEQCGEECKKHIQLEHCAECAESCLHCAAECRKMAASS